jgi:CRP-like cAMP-binding protein
MGWLKAWGGARIERLRARKKHGKTLERLRSEFQKGNRSVRLRLQYAEVLEQAGRGQEAVPVLLGLAAEFLSEGAKERALEAFSHADRIAPGRTDITTHLVTLREEIEGLSADEAAVPPAAAAPDLAAGPAAPRSPEVELVVVAEPPPGWPHLPEEGEADLVRYVQELAARFPVPTGPRPPRACDLAGALFEGLSAADLRALLPGLRRYTFDPGHAVLNEGERGGGFFILVRGRARVLLQSAHGRLFQVAEIEEGSFFGEMSLLSRPRTATVVTAGVCEVLEIKTETLESLTQRRPLAKQILEETTRIRISSPDGAAVRSVPPIDPDLPERALHRLEAHFGETEWKPRMRLRLADVLARAGDDRDVVPILVGLAEALANEGNHPAALAVLLMIDKVPGRADEPASSPSRARATAPSGGPGSAILSYVQAGGPAPSARAIDHLRQWLHAVMSDMREPTTTAYSPSPPGSEAKTAGFSDMR